MERVICCVCEKPIEGKVFKIGNRPYGADCYAKVARNRRGLWWASLIGIGALVLFVATVALIARATKPHLEGTPLVLVSLLLALVPALIWLAFFYIQDAREPEPKALVLAVFLLGALLARAVGIPIINDLFHTSSWFSAGPLFHILGAILIVGFTQQFLVFAAVRYTVYYSKEFDERVDGIVYATAAALGYATMVNVQYILESGGVDLASGIFRIAVTAMALASFGGLVGFFLGRCKFEDEPLWWMPAGLALAAVLDGLFTYFRGEITSTPISLKGGGYNPWLSLILGTVVAGLTFAVLFLLLRRLERRASQSAGA